MSAVPAGSLIRQRRSSYDVSFDIKADFGAVGDGIANDSNAFGMCLDAISVRADRVTVTYPPGRYATPDFPCLYPFDTNPAIMNWVRDITSQGVGATFATVFTWVAGGDHPQDNSSSGFFRTNNVGDTSVTLINLADVSKFKVGNVVWVTGLTLQYQSYPANFWIQESKRVTAVDAETGVITLDTPLKYQYKDTWPTYNVSGIDCGAAKLVGVAGGNDMSIILNGWTFETPYQMYCKVQELKYYNLTINGEGAIASGTKNYLANGCNFNNPVAKFEMDKLVENCRIVNCHFEGSIIHQSSLENLSMYGTTVVADLWGTAKNTVIDNCRINAITTGLAYGGFGYSENVTVSNSHFDYLSHFTPNELISDWTFNNGVFFRPNVPVWNPETQSFSSGGPLAFGVPGAKLYLWIRGANRIYPPAFRVLDITQDATTTYVHTTLRSIPVYTGYDNSQPQVFGPWGCENLSVINCTGMAGSELSLPNAVGKRQGEYSNKTYTFEGWPGDHGVQNIMWGNLVSFKIDVIKPYTGTQANCRLEANSASGGSPVCDSSFVVRQWSCVIDLKAAGLRTITPTSITGQQPGDTLQTGGAEWFCGAAGSPYLFNDMRGEPLEALPIVNVEIILAQESDWWIDIKIHPSNMVSIIDLIAHNS